MKIVLVRHGRPDEGHAERPHDPPLADDGRRQAEAVADALAAEGIDRIVTSPLLRARQTAEPLATRLGLVAEVVDGWAEADRHLARYRSVETLKISDHEHHTLIDAIESGDRPQAEAAMRAHLTTLSDNLNRISHPAKNGD